MRTTHRAHALAPLFLSALVSALALAALAPSTVDAQRRPFYAGFGLGGQAFVTENWRACCDVNFRVQGEFGWHPGGDDSGFFLAGEAIFTVGDAFLMFMPGLRLGGDIEVHSRRDVTVFLRPSALFGGGFWDPDDPARETLGFFLVQPAFDIRLALARHVVQLWLRPVAFDVMLFPDYYDRRGFNVVASYVFQAGLDFAF